MDNLVEHFRKLDTASVSDAMDKIGIECACYGIKPIRFGQKICGRAFTVHYVPCGVVKGTVGDFLDSVNPGQVVVIDNAGRTNCTVWGDLMSNAAKKLKIEGTVIDGVCRDIPEILKCGYQVFAKGYYMRTGKDRVYAEAINRPVMLSDIIVYPNDIILGDDSGVVVIPQKYAEKILHIAEIINDKEGEVIHLLEQGYPLKDAREKIGYHFLQTKDKNV